VTTVDSEPLLQVRGVTKSFGASRALNGVSFDLQRGEIHALIGENGAGKSTLMKVLSGAELPDSGTMTLDGGPYAPSGPRAAIRQGVAMIYQELALAPHLTVEANVMLGQERSRRGLLRTAENRRVVREALDLLEHPEMSPDRVVGTLSVGSQQLVEVARALVSNARVVIFDEPTSSLTETDAARLFKVIRRLRAKGIAVVYISHFLEEVRALAQRYTVLRDGATVATGRIEEAEMKTIVAQMIGREIDEIFPKVPHEPGETVLKIVGLKGKGRFPQKAELEVKRGEILGIAGLVGSGRTEFLRAVYGLDAVASGKVTVKGVLSRVASPGSRIREGMGFVSEDRKREGLALSRSIEDNMTYPGLDRHTRWGWVRLGQRRREVEGLIGKLGIRSRGPTQNVGDLSGGNQQKVAVARLLHQEADVLLLDDPTRGIDVGSKAEIYRLIGALAAKGMAVVMVSSYLPELFGVCDRIAVMCRGLLSEARPTSEWDEHSVMTAATS
jgi:ribose transport system ATP-binding protein